MGIEGVSEVCKGKEWNKRRKIISRGKRNRKERERKRKRKRRKEKEVMAG